MFSRVGLGSEVFCGWHAVEHNGMIYEVNGSTASLEISVNVKQHDIVLVNLATANAERDNSFKNLK